MMTSEDDPDQDGVLEKLKIFRGKGLVDEISDT